MARKPRRGNLWKASIVAWSQPARQGQDIVIHANEVFVSRLQKAERVRVGPDVALEPHMPHDARMLCLQHLTHLTRAIIAGIVHDDELKGLLGIGDHRVHRVRKKLPPVNRREHDAEALIEAGAPASCASQIESGSLRAGGYCFAVGIRPALCRWMISSRLPHLLAGSWARGSVQCPYQRCTGRGHRAKSFICRVKRCTEGGGVCTKEHNCFQSMLPQALARPCFPVRRTSPFWQFRAPQAVGVDSFGRHRVRWRTG